MCIKTPTINPVNNHCLIYCSKNAYRLPFPKSRKGLQIVGRPPVPTHLKRDKRLVVMLTEAENEAFTDAATAAGAASLSDWVRDLLSEAAKKQARRK